MTLTENYGLVLPKNYVSINSTEMEYVDGGYSAKDWAFGITCSLIASAIWKIASKAISASMVQTALYACAGVAKAVWAGISSAAAWIWNTAVALAIAAGVVGIGVGIVIGYYCW